MSATVLRQRVLLALCGLSAALVCLALWMTLTVSGDFGMHSSPGQAPFLAVVTSIDPNSPAAVAGLRAGDSIETRALSPGDRFRLWNGPAVGERIELPIVRDGMRRAVALTAGPLVRAKFWHDDGWDQVLSMAGEFWAICVAALIIWRCPGRLDAILLALSLMLTQFGVAMTSLNFWVTPWPALDATASVVGQVLMTAAIVSFTTYTLLFARPISALRWLTVSLTYALCVYGALTSVVGTVGQWAGSIDPQTWFAAQTVPTIVLSDLSLLFPLGCAALALRDARGSERARLAWASGWIAVNYFASIWFQLAFTLNAYVHAATMAVDVSVFITPLGLTYALLSRRLLDVGFVLNRATVFAATSLLIAGVFAGLQWSVGALLQGIFHVHDFLSQAIVVIAAYYIVRLTRRQTDAFITHVFFAKRDRRLRAIHDGADAIDEVDQPESIAPFIVQYLAEHAGISARISFDVDDRDSFVGEVAFPMLVRRRLRGTMFCRLLDDGELAPDETRALQLVAQRIANDRDDLIAESARDELRELRRVVEEIRA